MSDFFSVFSGIGGRMSFSFSRNSALIDFALRHFGYPLHDRNGPRHATLMTIGWPHFSHTIPVSGGLIGLPRSSQSEMNLHFASGHCTYFLPALLAFKSRFCFSLFGHFTFVGSGVTTGLPSAFRFIVVGQSGAP